MLAVTDDKSKNLQDRRDYQIEHIHVASNNVKLIKLADLCSNIVSIPDSWSKDRVITYLNWCEQLATLCFPASEVLAIEFRSRLLKAKQFM